MADGGLEVFSSLTGTLRGSPYLHGRWALVGDLYEQDGDGSLRWANYDAELRAGDVLELLDGDAWHRGTLRFADELGGYHLMLEQLEVSVTLERLATEGRTLRKVRP